MYHINEYYNTTQVRTSTARVIAPVSGHAYENYRAISTATHIYIQAEQAVLAASVAARDAGALAVAGLEAHAAAWAGLTDHSDLSSISRP